MKIEASPAEAASAISSQANESEAIASAVQNLVREGKYKDAYHLMGSLRERVNALFANLEEYLNSTE